MMKARLLWMAAGLSLFGCAQAGAPEPSRVSVASPPVWSEWSGRLCNATVYGNTYEHCDFVDI